MFGSQNEAGPPDRSQLRETLFADAPLELWRPGEPAANEKDPWLGFEQAREALGRGDRVGAITVLHRLARTMSFEARQRVQAWTALRALGCSPGAEEAKHVCGVVIDVHLEQGLDTLAAYDDRVARYINHGGNVIVWESSAPVVNRRIDELLAAAQSVVEYIGPWQGPRPGAPDRGLARISLLTPSGLHFGEGPFEDLSADPMGGAILDAGARLMTTLIDMAEQS
jgi:hypothetical protein